MSAAGFRQDLTTFVRVAALIFDAPDGARIALIAPTLNQARGEWLEAVRELVSDCQGASMAAGYSSGGNLRATFPGDVQVLFFGANYPDRMRGFEFWRRLEIR